ncbi:hypothetical protein BC938DRAFT_480947 [Jimgerdemannia flammicorona]|uniref:Kelch repeat protein n=1 Tax=Jimgerdemannia flammicorona TaxID=994334 RepID=A0A433QHA6_9FUNG|nr:hypothetical protein BC938DRAFT_480947 [Jimgerdemannia flammicorona]
MFLIDRTGEMIIIGGMYQIRNGTKLVNVGADMANTPIYNSLIGHFVRYIVPYLVTAPNGYTLIVYGGSAPALVTTANSTIHPNIGYEETPLGDVQVLNTKTYEWSSPTTTGIAPSARFGHAAVQVGWQMIVMGGRCAKEGSKVVVVVSEFSDAIWRNLLRPFLTIPHTILGSTGRNVTNETIVLDTTRWSWLTQYTPTVWIDIFNQTSNFSTTFGCMSTPSSTSMPTSTSLIPVELIVVISVGTITAIAAFTAVIIFLMGKRAINSNNPVPHGPDSSNPINPIVDDDSRSTAAESFNPTPDDDTSPTEVIHFNPIRDDGARRPLMR